MEQWEVIIERPLEEGHRAYEKLLQTATAVLKKAATHLAAFETEWVMETLLYAPVHLLSTISQRRGDDAWGKVLADALKLLTTAVTAGACNDKHYDHIVDVCLLSYSASLRALALACVTRVAERSGAAARAHALRHSLGDATQCRAPLALLVGALCEHHPAVVSDDVTEIWRGYLNMLENTKNTDTVIKAVLEGINGLMKHFGDQLPTAELGQLYDNITYVYVKKPICQPACFTILRAHCPLFKERVSRDRALRALLWDAAPGPAAGAILSVYTVIAQCVDSTTLKKILTTEVFPHVQSPSSQTKLTSLRVLAATKTDCFGDLTQYVDVHTLEQELRNERVSYADAETVLWCVEYNQPNSERLLMAAILFYENLPAAFRMKIVTTGILNSPPEIKRAVIQFLISRCCDDPDCQLWRDLNDADDEAAMLLVARELAECVVTALETVLEDEGEEPPKLTALLRLTSLVSGPARAALPACAAPLVSRAHTPAALAAARAALTCASVEHVHCFYKCVRVSSCRDEATLHEASLALAQAPDDVHIDGGDMLTALQIIFSSDVAPKVHGAALRKFDYLLTNDKCLHLDIRDVIRSVEKLRARGDRTDREVRVLHREVTMFLGKHGSADINNNRDGFDDSIVVDLKKSLTLTLPCQGTSYKVDLKTLLLLALQHEDPSALQTLLAMLSANLSSNKEQSTQRAIVRVVRALASAHAAGCGDYTAAIEQAVRQCGDAACGTDLLQFISSTKSCGVRKLLSTALSALCEDNDMLQLAVERASVMMISSESTTKRAGLDIAETILACLENNNSFSKTLLPELIVLIAKTNESDSKAIFSIASKTFIDKKELFDAETVKKTCRDLLENLLNNNLSDVKIYKATVKFTVHFIRNLRDVKLDDALDAMFDIIKNNVDIKVLYVLAVLKKEFAFDIDITRSILGREISRIMKSLFDVELLQSEEFFEAEAVLIFIEEYCEGVLELKYQETVQFLSELITKFTPTLVMKLHKSVKTCYTSLTRHCKGTPKPIISSFQAWVEMLPIKKITDAIDREYFLTEHKSCVEALKLMSNVFDIRETILSDVKSYIQRWPSLLLKLYSSGRLEEYFSDEIPYFTDILVVSLKFLTGDDVKKIIKSTVEFPKKQNAGIKFVGCFIQGFFEVLTEKPFILLDEDMRESSAILNDIVRLVLKKPSLKDRNENVLELVDKLWPVYERHATFTQKHCLLTNLECLPGPGPDSNPLQWVVQSVCSRGAALDERIRLLALVPEECFKSPEVMSAAASLFPARLSELRPSLLDAVAARPAALLNMLAALAAGDSTTGWWDSALEWCLSAAGRRSSLLTCAAGLGRWRGERGCERVLVPLLRHSSVEVCEKFLAPLLTRILGNLNKKPRGDAPPAGHEKRLDEYMASLHLLLLAYEKLPTWSLESPYSTLYSAVGTTVSPWHLVREGCRLCHSLWDVKCPATASDELRAMYRKFQCVLYNSQCAGVCRRRPGAQFYAPLFSADILERIVDEHDNYDLPIRTSWMQRSRALPVAVPVESSRTLSPSHTQRSRIFLRTLSEDPMLFDLHTPQEEVMEVQDISLSVTALNRHRCACTLTALYRHAAAAPALAPQWTARAALLTRGPRNLRWLLAQIMCNCKEELQPHASVLLPGLLAVLTGTVDTCMNGLHIDVLETILYWKEEIVSDDFNIITHHLITTCMENRRKNVFDGLLKTLQGFLELYGSSIQIEWKSFETYYEDQHQDTQKALLQVIRLICRRKLYIPQLLSKIVSKMDADPSKMAECFGLALTACRDCNEKQEALGSFKKYLEKCNAVTSYVRVLYYACMGCAECCGEQEFRKITDYVTKVTSQERSKCLHILSCYLTRRPHCQYVADMFDTVDLSDMIAKDQEALLLVKTGLPAMSETLRRRCVAQLAALNPATPKVKRLLLDAMLAACQELFSQPTQPPAKRQKAETTPILSMDREDSYTNSVLTCLGLGAVDIDPDVAKAAREALGAKMDKDLGARFLECYLLCVHLPAHSDRPLDVCVCVSALLDMLYSDLRSADSFRNCRLRDEPLPIRETDQPSRLLTLSKTFRGTFSSYSATRGRVSAQQDANKPAIDVQVPIDSILENLLEFAKTTPEAARALLTSALRSVLTSTKFELTPVLVPLLGSALGREPTDLTPLYIDVCRVLVKHGDVHSLLSPAERLVALTAGTEGAALARLLYEELTIQCVGDDLFLLGTPGGIEDVVMSDDTLAFSIEDMKCAFGKLSDWDDLTIQQRRAVKSSLPPLWTDRKEFLACLDSYEVPPNAQCWFDKMAAAYKQEMGPNSVRWLKKMAVWPTRHFEISAITEATSWRHEASEVPPSHLFKTTDCLAEWAARLMIRSAYYSSLQHSATEEDDIPTLSRSHELQWCVRANEMGIPSVALQCVDRNVEELCESETLPWLRQKLLSLRGQALERNDLSTLRNVLKKAETSTSEYSTDPSVSIQMYHLMLMLHKDLKSLTHRELQTILTHVNLSAQEVDWSTASKQAVSSVYETAMTHYDDVLEEGSLTPESTVPCMVAVFCRAASLAAPTADMLLAMLLRRLDESPTPLSVDAASQLLEQISPLVSHLDTFTLELLQKNSSKFPPELQKSFRALLPQDPRVEKYRRCLQLICDPYHLLLHYCEELVQAVRTGDGGLWKTTFDRMKHKIYENPYAGPTYKLLDKYKADLYGMYEFEPTPEFASQAEAKLKPIMMGVRRPPQATLRVGDLCPTLLGHVDASMGTLLGLQQRVVNIHDTVQVFTDSIRRPVVISMLLSNGQTRRVMQKTGERLASDAAAQRVAACAQRLGCGPPAYSVTLLDEESALIEFLEGHERLRTLIASTCDLEVAHTVSRPADGGLAESPAAALRAHRLLCATVPAHALRSAIELNSSCVQDFIFKKQNFTDSLASMTILTWLLGLGDRHLQNIMCSRAGAVRAVDWGAVWACGAQPPARLTRVLTAASGPPVLEARLQTTLVALRRSAGLLEASVRVAFHWASPSLDDQLRHVRAILRGGATCYHVTRDVTGRDARLRHRDKYVTLLDQVFAELPDKQHYSVEEQVSCLLRHCTSPEILSVTRAGWEPWV